MEDSGWVVVFHLVCSVAIVWMAWSLTRMQDTLIRMTNGQPDEALIRRMLKSRGIVFACAGMVLTLLWQSFGNWLFQ